jgi:nitrite reductase (cytochrome c-552)
MRPKGPVLLTFLLAVALGVLPLVGACAEEEPETVRTGTIPADAIDPAEWGNVYPVQYDLWRATSEARPAGESPYKRGGDEGKEFYCKLSEFPFMALLFNGWGFGVEYNEPRGHAYMVTDQLEIDPSRVKAGGGCLTCKTPYAPVLAEEMGAAYWSDPYLDVHANIPEEFQELGVACIDCHDNETLAVRLTRPALTNALADIGVDHEKATRQELRSLACAQCHVTYVLQRDEEMKPVDLIFPWQGSSPGHITVENIIEVVKDEPSYYEWTHNVTGYKMAFIRHPEYEFFTAGSVHANAGLSCADCHMPYTRVGAAKVSDHDVKSPLKNDLSACTQCHPGSEADLKAQVVAIQERTIAVTNRAGYATAVAAKLIERTHTAQEEGKPVDQNLYDQAKDLYLEAFYRTNYLGAENSVGFHNPTEAGRIAGDAVAMATQCQALLRQALTEAGVAVPTHIDLELSTYLNDRGEKGLMFDPDVELKDPTGVQEMLTPLDSLGL